MNTFYEVCYEFVQSESLKRQEMQICTTTLTLTIAQQNNNVFSDA